MKVACHFGNNCDNFGRTLPGKSCPFLRKRPFAKRCREGDAFVDCFMLSEVPVFVCLAQFQASDGGVWLTSRW